MASKAISDYALNTTIETTDRLLIQKGSNYFGRVWDAFLASQAEVDAGTNAVKIVTPVKLATWWTTIKTLVQTFTANVTFTARVLTAKGADVVAANDLTLGADGNTFIITGNTQVNAITTSGWSAGSRIILIFTGTPTVKHNTAGGAGTAVLFLNGSLDLVAANNTVLDIVFDGTQWQEVSRKVA